MEDKEKLIKILSLQQGAIKILINSIYGASGNKWFYFYNLDIAQSITLQGQDMIKFANRAIDYYFKEKWHLDTELHEKLGISQYKIEPISKDIIIAIYTDTDSTYVNYGPAIDSIKGLNLSTEEGIKLCIKIDEYRIAGFYDDAFEKWSKKFNTKNRQTFKLENMSSEGFWIKKKNYALRVIYEPNPKQELLSDEKQFLLIKGLEPIKSSYPEWARNHQTAFIDYLLKQGRNVNLEGELIPMIKTIREEYDRITNPEEIAQNFNIREYDKYVVSEKNCELAKGATLYPKATIHHNYLIEKHQLEGRYPKLRQGSKIKFLYTIPDDTGLEVFAYNPGQFPEEIAPKIDNDQQFFILIVEPINRILKAFGVNEIDINLRRAIDFKTTNSKKPLTEKQLFPLHVINSETLEHEEVPEKFWHIINNNEEAPEEIYDEYLDVITKYGLNTVIVINKNLESYKKRISKKLANKEDESEDGE